MKNKDNDPRESIREVFQRLHIRDEPVLVAVSGGADSVALLLLLNKLQDEFNLTLHVGHFDHQLRDESHADAEWVETLADALEIKCTIGSPHANAKIQSTGIEESARKLRYEFLQSLAVKLQSHWVAVAHTENDQVETVLHHITRGTGLKGLRGIPEVRQLSSEVNLIRPLLNVNRQQLVDELSRRDQQYRSDRTNLDSTFTRNRIRNDILPYLKEHLNPQLDQALLRLSRQAEEAQFAIDDMAAHLLEKATTTTSDQKVLRINAEPFRDQPRAVVIAAMILIWERRKWPRQKMSQHHWGELFSIVDENSTTHRINCPAGIQVTRRSKVIEFKRNSDLQ